MVSVVIREVKTENKSEGVFVYVQVIAGCPNHFQCHMTKKCISSFADLLSSDCST
jgi:hypothetical protein